MISIITPTYNRAHLLPRMVESVLKQTYKNWELIIMDDGSTDSTRGVIDSYKDTRIRFFDGENSGASDKRNKGVGKAKSNLIIFLDSDDAVQEDWLEELMGMTENKIEVVVTCGYQKLDEKGEVIARKMPQDLGLLFNHQKLNFLSGTLLLPKKYFEEIGGYDIHLPSGQHTELMLRLIPLFEKYQTEIKIVNNTLLNIYVHQGARIRHNFIGVYQGGILTIKKHSKLFAKDPEWHFNYISSTAVSGFKAGKIKAAKKLIAQGVCVRPFYYKAYIRYIIINIPILRNNIWSK